MCRFQSVREEPALVLFGTFGTISYVTVMLSLFFSCFVIFACESSVCTVQNSLACDHIIIHLH